MIVKIDQDLEVEGSKTAEGGQSSVDLGQDLGDDFTPEFDIEGKDQETIVRVYSYCFEILI